MSHHLHSRVVVAALAVVIFGGAAVGVLWATDTIGQSQDQTVPEGLPPDFEKFPPEKQAIELEELRQRQAAEAGPHAPKPTGSPMTSCPVDLKAFDTGIGARIFAMGPPQMRNMVNEAGVVSVEGTPYRIYARAAYDDPEQGLFIVEQQVLDLCAAAAGLGPQAQAKEYRTPFHNGAVSITAVEGDTVLFQTPDGKTGRFGYLTGEFSAP